MFLFSSGDGGCQDAVVQMGGSGEGARGTVSRISADGASRMQLQWQTVLMKHDVNLPQPGAFPMILTFHCSLSLGAMESSRTGPSTCGVTSAPDLPILTSGGCGESTSAPSFLPPLPPPRPFMSSRLVGLHYPRASLSFGVFPPISSLLHCQWLETHPQSLRPRENGCSFVFL